MHPISNTSSLAASVPRTADNAASASGTSASIQEAQFQRQACLPHPGSGAKAFLRQSPQGRAIRKAENALEKYRAEPGSRTGQTFLALFGRLEEMASPSIMREDHPYSQYLREAIARLQAAAEEIKQTLDSAFKMHYVPDGASDLDKKAFSADVQTAMDRSQKFNRTDILRDIQLFLDGQGVRLNLAHASDADALNAILEAGTTGRAKSEQNRIGKLAASHPKPPGDALRIHQKSLQMFLDAKCGQAFSGLIHIRGHDSYKVFLAPLMPSQGSLQEPDKIYAVRGHDAQAKYGIYEKRNIAIDPIEHYRVFNGTPLASHEQFVNFIKNKYGEDGITSGKYVGFAVTKGRIAEGVANRYAFVSRTVNPSTFASADGKEGSHIVPVEWQKTIRRTFDRLSLIEYAMHREQASSSGGSSQASADVDPSRHSPENAVKLHASHVKSIQDFLGMSGDFSSDGNEPAR